MFRVDSTLKHFATMVGDLLCYLNFAVSCSIECREVNNWLFSSLKFGYAHSIDIDVVLGTCLAVVSARQKVVPLKRWKLGITIMKYVYFVDLLMGHFKPLDRVRSGI